MRHQKADLQISKLAAARRQIDAAIRMFFSQEDKLATYTVASAAYKILRDILKRRGKSALAGQLRANVLGVANALRKGTLSDWEKEGLIGTELWKIITQVAEMDDDSKFTLRISPDDEMKHFWRRDKPANFLKHADRDSEDFLAINDVDLRGLLTESCMSYLDVMRVPTPEMEVYFAFQFAESGDDFNTSSFAPHLIQMISALKKLSGQSRLRKCARMVANRTTKTSA
ncbi:MAG TPA: hypothetical protein VN802_22225 [Stellaceae bacterium]|nr:hypothetical protein [Stellaceae bacterium]